MGGKNVVATDIRVGDVVDYHGEHATVTKVWSKQVDSPTRNMISPVGIEIEWTSETLAFVNDAEVRGEQINRTRLVWPDVPPDEQPSPQIRDWLPDAEIKRRLAADLKKRPVKRYKAAKP